MEAMTGTVKVHLDVIRSKTEQLLHGNCKIHLVKEEMIRIVNEVESK